MSAFLIYLCLNESHIFLSFSSSLSLKHEQNVGQVSPSCLSTFPTGTIIDAGCLRGGGVVYILAVTSSHQKRIGELGPACCISGNAFGVSLLCDCSSRGNSFELCLLVFAIQNKRKRVCEYRPPHTHATPNDSPNHFKTWV